MPLLSFSPALKLFTDRHSFRKPPNNPQSKPRNLFKRFTASAHATSSRNPCSPIDIGDGGERVSSSRITSEAIGFGSNSVHFPDINSGSMDDMGQDNIMASPFVVSRPLSMDITRLDCQEKTGKYLKRHSSDLERLQHDHQPVASSMPRTLMEESVLSSEYSPFSGADHSLFSRGQCSTQTSLTSSSSTVLTNRNTADLSQCTNITSSRPRHTKLLGAPRSLHRPYTLSATSLSTLNSFPLAESVGRPHHQIIPTHPSHGATNPGHQLYRTSTTSLNNLNIPQVSWTVPEDECEQLTNELTSSMHNHLHFHSAHVHDRLATVKSQQHIRQKVPLDEVIGKPSLPNLRQSPSLSSCSPLIMSSSHAAMRSHPALRELSLNTAAHCAQPNSLAMDRPLSRTDSIADSTTTTNTTSQNSAPNVVPESFALAPRNRTSTLNSSPGMSFATPNPRLEMSHQNHQTIEEVDEDSGDISYEFMERPDCDTSSQLMYEKKRKRGLIHNYRELRKGFSNSEQPFTKSINISPSHPKPNQKIKVMAKLGLIKSTNRDDSDTMDQYATDEDPPSPEEEDQSVTPTKKIKYLENEVQRLRRELESEKLRHSQDLQRSTTKMHPSLLLSRSRKGFFSTSQTPSNAPSQQQQQNDSTRVRFTPKSAWSSSPASATRFGRFRTSDKDHQVTKDALTGTPVLIRKPSEGVMIGGSPFVVSRVFGEGPEVIGEKTPEAAHKRNAAATKLRALSTSQGAIKLPGLAQDLFGAGSGLSGPGGKKVKADSGPIELGKWKGKGKQIDLQDSSAFEKPLQSAKSTTSSGWVRDSELDEDLFGRGGGGSSAQSQHHRRHSLAPLIGVSSGRPNLSSSVSLNSTLKPKHAYRNSIGGTTFPSTGSGQDGKIVTGDMASFLNELKSAGKDKLRKTVGSLKYYNPQNHFGSSRASVLSPHQMPLPRDMDPKNAEIMNFVLEQDFGKYAQCTPRRSEFDHLEGSSTLPADQSTSLDKSKTGSKDDCLERPPKSPLSCRIYPSSTSFGMGPQTADSTVASSSANDLVDNRTSDELETTESLPLVTSAVTEPIGLGIERELGEEAQQSIQSPAAPDRPRFASDPTPTFALNVPRTPQRTVSEAVLTCTMNPSEPKSPPSSQHTSRGHGQVSTGRPLSEVDPNRGKAQATTGPVSILSGSSKVSEHSSGSFRRASTSSNGTRRVRIIEDSSRRNSHRSSLQIRQATIPDENLVSVVEEEEAVIGGTGMVKGDPGKVVGFGVEPGKALSSSGSDWVVVKSDGDRLGDGEENLRRWSLKASAILKAHPKIVYPPQNDEN